MLLKRVPEAVASLHPTPLLLLQPLFTMSAQQQSVQPFSPQDYEQLTNQFERQPVSPSQMGGQAGGASPRSRGWEDQHLSPTHSNGRKPRQGGLGLNREGGCQAVLC